MFSPVAVPGSRSQKHGDAGTDAGSMPRLCPARLSVIVPAIGHWSRQTTQTKLWKPRWRTSTKDKTEAAYKRADALEKRRRLMRDWARHCGSAPQSESATVTPIGRGRA